MGMKYHAKTTASHALGAAAANFLMNPSARQFLVMDACMKAYQLAFSSTEKEISQLLAGCKTEDIVRVLANKQQADIDYLAEEVAAGRAKVFTEPSVAAVLRAL